MMSVYRKAVEDSNATSSSPPAGAVVCFVMKPGFSRGMDDRLATIKNGETWRFAMEVGSLFQVTVL